MYNLVLGIGIVLALLFFCLQLQTGLIHRDPSALSRAGLGLARYVLGSFLVIAITASLLETVDQLCIGIVQATGTTMEEMGGRLAVLAAGLTAINIAELLNTSSVHSLGTAMRWKLNDQDFRRAVGGASDDGYEPAE